jgi:hypothetical protein
MQYATFAKLMAIANAAINKFLAEPIRFTPMRDRGLWVVCRHRGWNLLELKCPDCGMTKIDMFCEEWKLN